MDTHSAVLMHGDCLIKMCDIADQSVSLVLCDLPFGTTARNAWDKKIPLQPLWNHFWRILKPNGVVALWSQMPYTAELVMSMPKQFRYEWVIEKTRGTGFLNANKMPIKAHESVLIFYRSLPTYHPQVTTGHPPVHSYKRLDKSTCYGNQSRVISGGGSTERYPRDVLLFRWDTRKSQLHPTQKPVKANEYFILTYTNPGETVLDCCMGSGSTGVAALNTGRCFIGIEKDDYYFNIAESRISMLLK